jgi:hypothetical protein
MISILSRVGVSARRMSLAASAMTAPGFPCDGVASVAEAGEPSWQLVRDRDQIVHVLRHFLETGQEVSLGDRDRKHLLRGRIVAMVGSRPGHLLIEAMADKIAAAALLRDGRVNLASRFLDLPVVFPVQLSDAGTLGGKSLFRASLPEWMLFSELRDSLRIAPPADEPMQAIIAGTRVSSFEADVVDLGEGGVGLLLSPQPTGRPSIGERWPQVSLRSHDGEIFLLDLELRHVSLAQGNRWRIGASIEAISEPDRQRLNRMIVRHQHLFQD